MYIILNMYLIIKQTSQFFFCVCIFQPNVVAAQKNLYERVLLRTQNIYYLKFRKIIMMMRSKSLLICTYDNWFLNETYLTCHGKIMNSVNVLNFHRIFKRQAKALIRLRVCTGWSEALLVAHTTVGNHDSYNCAVEIQYTLCQYFHEWAD